MLLIIHKIGVTRWVIGQLPPPSSHIYLYLDANNGLDTNDGVSAPVKTLTKIAEICNQKEGQTKVVYVAAGTYGTSPTEQVAFQNHGHVYLILQGDVTFNTQTYTSYGHLTIYDNSTWVDSTYTTANLTVTGRCAANRGNYTIYIGGSINARNQSGDGYAIFYASTHGRIEVRAASITAIGDVINDGTQNITTSAILGAGYCGVASIVYTPITASGTFTQLFYATLHSWTRVLGNNDLPFNLTSTATTQNICTCTNHSFLQFNPHKVTASNIGSYAFYTNISSVITVYANSTMSFAFNAVKNYNNEIHKNFLGADHNGQIHIDSDQPNTKISVSFPANNKGILIVAHRNSTIYFACLDNNNGCVISGSATYTAHATRNGVIDCTGKIYSSGTFSAYRYNVAYNGTIITSGNSSGTNYFPGTNTGVIGNGGVYV